MKGLNGFLSAVNFDNNTLSVVKSAARLAQRARAGLELVHVHETWDRYGVIQFLGHNQRAKDLVRNADAESLYRAETLLARLAEDLVPADVPVRTRVLSGNAGDVLVSEARHAGDMWLVSGFQKTHSPFFPKNISTTLTLATDSPVPVLFVPEGGERAFERPSLNILAADDLTPQALGTIKAACELATWYGDSHVWHAHVSMLDEKILDSAITTAFAEARAAYEPGLAAKELFELLAEAMRKKLSDRLVHEGDCPAKHHSIIRFGRIEDELEKLRGEYSLDIAIFGRHRIFHLQPFYVGNLPFASMFKLNVPILIMPDERKES